jgi:magnesium chelatase family protein
MQPCPCGFYGDPIRECTCSVEDILSYSQRLQETIDACFDLHVEVPIGEDVMKQRPGERSVAIRQRVEVARALQQRRYMQATNLWVNADIQSVDDSALYCQVNSPAEKLLSAAYQQLHFTPRQSIQTLRLARTIADLAESEVIAGNHVAEAIQYRSRLGR